MVHYLNFTNVKYIVAGNFEEYRRHIEKKGYNSNEYLYVSSPYQLRGLYELEGFYIGTYYERPDIKEIQEIIARYKERKEIEKNKIYKANTYQTMQPTSIMIRTKNASGNNEWQTFNLDGTTKKQQVGTN